MNKLHHRFENNISLTTATYTEQERVGGRNDKRRTVDEMRKRWWSRRNKSSVSCSWTFLTDRHMTEKILAEIT